MTDREVLIDFYITYWQKAHQILRHTPADALVWRPGGDLHCIAIYGWHLARSLDLLTVRLMVGNSAENELWFRNGWRDRTGYDPTDIGYGGFGNLSGYAPSEVDEVPLLTTDELVAYFESAHDQFISWMRTIDDSVLGELSADMQHHEQTRYEWVRNFLNDGRETLGTMRTIKKLWASQYATDR